MHNVMEKSILLRQKAQIPSGIAMHTEVFSEGWDLAQSLDASELETSTNTHGWHFIRIAGGFVQCGVGQTSQEATTSALRLSLTHVGEHFNAIEVALIEITRYPWFFLARVQIASLRIQQSAVLLSPGDYEPIPIKAGNRCLPDRTTALYSNFSSAMPLLKRMLISPATAHRRHL